MIAVSDLVPNIPSRWVNFASKKWRKKWSYKLIGLAKGQIKPKADWRRRFSQKIKEQNCFFATKSKKAKKTNWFVRFLGESMACQSSYDFIWPLLFLSRSSFIKPCLYPWTSLFPHCYCYCQWLWCRGKANWLCPPRPLGHAYQSSRCPLVNRNMIISNIIRYQY